MKAVTADVIFIWIGDGLNRDDIAYGVWLDKHMREAERAPGEPNLFFLPAGDSYPHLCKAADVLFMPSRMDPLPNIVFDAAASGASIILFEGASGFDDEVYCKNLLLRHIPYGRLDLAAQAILSAPRKSRRISGLFSTVAARATPQTVSEDEGPQRIFASLREALLRPPPPLPAAPRRSPPLPTISMYPRCSTATRRTASFVSVSARKHAASVAS